MTMYNPFLVIRTVFFALLLMFSLLLLGFAAWNVNATSAVGFSVSGTSIFMIFTSCVLFFFIGSATIEYFKPEIRSTSVTAECVWVAVVALFQLGAAISTTISGSFLACRLTGDWSICASASVLVPISWLNSFIAFAYFFTLFTSVMSHVPTHPDIFARTIYTVDWFIDAKLRAFLQQGNSQPRLVSWSEYLDGFKSTAERKKLYGLEDNSYDEEKAPWAENISVRRGKDDPYAASTTTRSYALSGRLTPFSSAAPLSNRTASVSNHSGRSLPYLNSSGRSTPATENASLPSQPPRILSKDISFGSRFVERLSRDLKRSMEPKLPQVDTVNPFPSTIENHDLPIPLPHKSEWVHAEGRF